MFSMRKGRSACSFGCPSSVVKLETLETPEVRLDAGCEGKRFVLFQQAVTPVRDTQYQEVTAWKYTCVRYDCNLSGLSRRDGSRSPCSIQIVLPLMSRASGLTDGVQPPLAGLSPTATAPSGRHPYRRPRSWGLAATIVSRPTRRRPRAETGPRMAADAELASGRVGQDDFRARSPFGKRGERESVDWLMEHSSK